MASVPQTNRTVSFIEWRTDYSPYVIELREDLLPRLIEEVEVSRKSQVEIRGVLVGGFPEADAPTIRIEDYVREHSRDEASEFPAGTQGVGFFRSHLGSGSAALSERDQESLGARFRHIYVALVVEATTARNAQWFLALNGKLYPRPAVPNFSFSPESFRSLSVARQVTVQQAASPKSMEEIRPARSAFLDSAPVRSSPVRSFSVVPFFLAGLALVAGFYFRPLLPGSILDEWLPDTSNRLNLKTTADERSGSAFLRISWNNRTPEIYRAKSATLTITDDMADREVELSRNDLTFGEVAYERAGSQVVVTLTLRMPDATTVSQSQVWPPTRLGR